ncbi:exocyst complex component Sec3-domain-containing protein [Gymnopilus junonius]|uniref:Exocyst complex component Sec3-domain-containing protein n=1 Tax=Gymnopilus junonius TaxID=109634 RepID=A0A9P5P0I5_GYMJU|nr:exocyst complex component Sec3-domain-containing protein [Gymnopilus junonius]
MADQRHNIIASVFSRRNAAGNLEETYVSHVKIWEDAGIEGGGRKPRYILLSQANNGSGFIHKSKLNTNGTFSVGKTWRLAELRAVQVISPTTFNLTLSRTYKWETESREDQASFLEAMIRLFRTVTMGQAPLQLNGVRDFDVSAVNAQPLPRDSRRDNRTPSPTNNIGRDLRGQTSYAPSQNGNVDNYRNPSPIPPLRPRNGQARTASPATRDRRPPSIVVPPPPAPISTHRARLPSNAASVSSQLPAVQQDETPPRVDRLARETSRTFSGTRVQNPSPAPSFRSRNLTRAENTSQQSAEASLSRRDQNARISYFDPSNQALLDQLILGADNQTDIEGEEENAQATLANVEEMIEGYEWASDDVIGRKMTKGAVDLIEARLLDELMALEKANIHSFLESDDRVAVVMKYMDDAIAELDTMDGLISSYKIHLNAVGEDISYIQSQNRGLQVQTQNQRALLAELQNLLRTVHVDQDALTTLTQESLEKPQSITRLEEAAVQLYKALQAGRDTDMAATMERLQEYRTYNSQFCKRLFDFLSIMFIAQSKMLLGDTSGLSRPTSRPTAISHTDLETYLGRYAGLLIYLREMDESIYSKLCATYFSATSDLHGTQMKALLSSHLELVKKTPDDDLDQGFGVSPSPLTSKDTVRRAGTLIRSPIERRQREKEKQQNDGELRASEVFGLFLEQVAKLVYQENDFIADFLQINDAGFTFADYMGLDNYFRRQAARSASLTQNTLKLIRGALDLIFGFLPAELKSWLDAALAKDSMEIVGILAFLERFLTEAEEKGNPFLLGLLEKQHTRLKIVFDRHISEQLKNIERTKLTSKKRKGVTSFVKNFPAYASRIENQLVGANNLEIRTHVDTAYEKIVQSMFDSLKQIAKLEGEGEDKGQLNYHVLLIENMAFFVREMSQLESMNTFTRRAEGIYDENLAAYIKIIFRRPFSKIIDFFEGLDRVARDASTSEATSNSSFNKSALKKVVKDYNAKDVKKHIDILAKRVEKHFTEDKSTADESGASGITSHRVLIGVWNACEAEFVKLTEAWNSRISQVYGDSGVSLEYTASDAESAFRRQKFGS